MSIARDIATAPTDRRILLFGDERWIGYMPADDEMKREWSIGLWRDQVVRDVTGYWGNDDGSRWIVKPLYWADLPSVPA